MQQDKKASFTTFTVFTIKKGSRLWALKQMGLMPAKLKNVNGLLFFKLMGSGKGLAFSILPDLGRYMLLAVWESEKAAESFYENSIPYNSYKDNSSEIWSVHLRPLQTKGFWDGLNPFIANSYNSYESLPLAVLTRGSIRPHKLPGFWKQALKSSNNLKDKEGLLFSCGIGELPFIRQVTFSIWKDLGTMKKFAYDTEEHKEAIRKRIKQHWYSEELFARFIISGSEGTINGINPLAEYNY